MVDPEARWRPERLQGLCRRGRRRRAHARRALAEVQGLAACSAAGGQQCIERDVADANRGDDARALRWLRCDLSFTLGMPNSSTASQRSSSAAEKARLPLNT